MEEWFVTATRYSALFIDTVALAAIVFGTVEALTGGLRAALNPRETNRDRREVWIRYSRWLVAALTFQLAADIIETSAAPTWDAIGKLAAIAAIRTALNFFLERDVAEMRARQHEPASPANG